MHHIFGTDNFEGIFFKSDAGIRNVCDQLRSVVLFQLVAGVLLGAFTGYFGGILDEILMRITDAVNGFPSILLTFVSTSLLGKDKQNVIITWDRVYPKLCADCPESFYVFVMRII